jgi:hypothetical protein
MSHILNLNKNYNIDLYKYTKISIGYRIGHSGYIDFITPEDFINNSNVVYGYDYDGRLFVSVLYSENGGQPKVMTLFQRYDDTPQFFVTCGKTFVHSNNVVSHSFTADKPLPQLIENFYTLINNKQVDVIDEVWDLELEDYKATTYHCELVVV